VIVLGIDPGTARTGYGVVAREGGSLRMLDYGCVETIDDRPPGARLLLIHEALSEVIETYRPELMGIERLYFGRNVRTAGAVGQARGVALLVAAQHGLPVLEHGPHEVKLAVTGYGRASKDQVGRMVQIVLALDAPPRPDDAADALAVAVCTAHAAPREILVSA
jgi:crossover junction endodeoxyribonuclease RuvC